MQKKRNVREFLAVCFLVSFFSVSLPLFSYQPGWQEFDVSNIKSVALPCIWLNGLTLLDYPPEPSQHLRYIMRIKPDPVKSNHAMPFEFDPFYLQRLFPRNALPNLLLPYYPSANIIRLSPNNVIDQLSDDEFLYRETKIVEDKPSFDVYYRFNPFTQTSSLLFSVNRKPGLIEYAGYLSQMDQYCFLAYQTLFLNRSGNQPVKEALFPPMLYYSTDNHSLFLFIDRDKSFSAYSVSEHKLIWENKDIIRNTGMKTISNLTQFELVTPHKTSDWALVAIDDYYFVLSLVTGKVMSRYHFPSKKYRVIKPFLSFHDAIWLQFFEKDEKQGDKDLFLARYTKPEGKKEVALSLFKASLPTGKASGSSHLEESKPVFFAMHPRLKKWLVVYQNALKSESQAIFGLP